VLLERSDGDLLLLPEVGGQVSVGGPQGVEHGLDEVTGGPGVAGGGGVAIRDARKGEDLLSNGGRDEPGSAGGRNETNANGSALSVNLGGDGVGLVRHTSPVSTADGDDVQLGNGDRTTDSGGDLSGALDSKANVSGVVTDSDKSLEAGALTSTRLLLHGHDPHDLVGEGEEVIDDLRLLDGNGVEEDLLNGGDPAVLHQTSKLGDGSPDIALSTVSSASTSTSASTSASTVISSSAEASSFSSFSHVVVLGVGF